MYRRELSAIALALLLSGNAWAAEPSDADNSARNQRDKDGTTLTATDQGGSEADRQITATIRKTIVDDGALSLNAHNVKIITIAGVVTLRGPVDSSAEKATVEAKAKAAAGVKRVDSQLEVASN